MTFEHGGCLYHSSLMPDKPKLVRVCSSCGASWRKADTNCLDCQNRQSTLVPQATADGYAARYKALVEAGEVARASRAAMSQAEIDAEDAETNRLMFGG